MAALAGYVEDVARADEARRLVEAEARERVKSAVRAALLTGASWRDIGRALGVSKQAAHERWSS